MKKYEHIVQDIETYIHDNQLQQGTRLMSVDAYAKEYAVSKSTIVKALDTLEKRGSIFQQRGSGVFVRRQRREGYVNLLKSRGFTDDLKGFDITTEHIKLQLITPAADVRTNLKLHSGDEVYYIERLVNIDGHRLCREISYYPKKIVPYLNEEIVKGSIFSYLTEALKLNISFADAYLNVDILSKEDGEKLELPEGSPALFLEQVIYLATGEPFDYSTITYNYKYAKFFVQSMNH